jgi:hypothetical protein
MSHQGLLRRALEAKVWKAVALIELEWADYDEGHNT